MAAGHNSFRRISPEGGQDSRRTRYAERTSIPSVDATQPTLSTSVELVMSGEQTKVPTVESSILSPRKGAVLMLRYSNVHVNQVILATGAALASSSTGTYIGSDTYSSIQGKSGGSSTSSAGRAVYKNNNTSRLTCNVQQPL